MALVGLRAFNAGEFFEAHEALETAWRSEPGPVRELYRGILQVAVGYYHLLRGNQRGALKMFRRCAAVLALFPCTCRGVDLAGLRRDFLRVEDALQRLDPQEIDHFDRRLLRPIRYEEE